MGVRWGWGWGGVREEGVGGGGIQIMRGPAMQTDICAAAQERDFNIPSSSSSLAPSFPALSLVITLQDINI